MATSQNGWPAGERADVGLTSVSVPGTAARLPVKAGDVATVLLWVATRWHNEIEPLVEPGNWGYAYRAVRGATTGLSNHASGTAIDLNAPAHPLGTEPLDTLSPAQVAAAERIEADSGGVVRWGGSYTGRKDPMHWEINAGAPAVAALARRISNPVAAASEEEFTVSQYDEIMRYLKSIDRRISGDVSDNEDNIGAILRKLDTIDTEVSRLTSDPGGPDRLRDVWTELQAIRGMLGEAPAKQG